MPDLSTFAQYNKLADQLIEKVSKDDLPESARLLALNVAHLSACLNGPLNGQKCLIPFVNHNRQILADSDRRSIKLSCSQLQQY